MIFLGALAGLIYPVIEPPDGEAPAMALRTGGMMGSAVAYLLLRYFHTVGAYLLTITALLVLTIKVTGIRPRGLAIAVGKGFIELFRWSEGTVRQAPRKGKRAKPIVAKASAKAAHTLERKRKKAQKLRRKLEIEEGGIVAFIKTEEGS